MKNQGRVVVSLVLVLVVVVFAVLNVEPVSISFGFAHVQWPLIIVIIVTLLLGALITLLVSTTSNYQNKKSQKALTAQVESMKSDRQTAIDQAVNEATTKQEHAFSKTIQANEAAIAKLQAELEVAQTPAATPKATEKDDSEK